MSISRKCSNGVRYRRKSYRSYAGRSLASIVILAFVIAVCLWAPMAFAAADSTAGAAASETAPSTGLQAAPPDPGPAAEGAAPIADTSPDSAITPEAPADVDVPDDNASSEEADAAAAVETDTAAESIDATPLTDLDNVPGAEPPANAGAATTGGAGNNPGAGSGNSPGSITFAGGDEECTEAGGSGYDEDCVDPEYKLELICAWGDQGMYWVTPDAYDDANVLAIVYLLSNTGSGGAYNLVITGATATNGVTLLTNLASILIPDLAPGDKFEFILQWLVPLQVQNFITDIDICADCRQELCEETEEGCPEPPCEETAEGCPKPPCEETAEGCTPVCEGDDCGNIDKDDPLNPPPVDPAIRTITPTNVPIQSTIVASETRTVLPSTGVSLSTLLFAGLTLALLLVVIPASLVAIRQSN